MGKRTSMTAGPAALAAIGGGEMSSAYSGKGFCAGYGDPSARGAADRHTV